MLIQRQNSETENGEGGQIREGQRISRSGHPPSRQRHCSHSPQHSHRLVSPRIQKLWRRIIMHRNTHPCQRVTLSIVFLQIKMSGVSNFFQGFAKPSRKAKGVYFRQGCAKLRAASGVPGRYLCEMSMSFVVINLILWLKHCKRVSPVPLCWREFPLATCNPSGAVTLSFLHKMPLGVGMTH